MGRSSPQILDGPRGLPAEFAGGPQGPVRVAEHLPGEEYQVGLPRLDDVIRLNRRRYQPHGTGPAPRFPADLLGEPGLVPCADGNPRAG